MDAKLKADWVKALRSGKYKQARFVLKSKAGFCCLGVLCVVQGIKIGKSGGQADQYVAIEGLIGSYGELTQLNDCEEKSFPEIADYIEANL